MLALCEKEEKRDRPTESASKFFLKARSNEEEKKSREARKGRGARRKRRLGKEKRKKLSVVEFDEVETN